MNLKGHRKGKECHIGHCGTILDLVDGYEIEFPAKCPRCSDGYLHIESCYGWDRCSAGWSSHEVQCDSCEFKLYFHITKYETDECEKFVKEIYPQLVRKK